MAGVRNLKEFGYADVNTVNILTAYIFRRFFARMIEDTIEKLPTCEAALALKKEIDKLDAEVPKA